MKVTVFTESSATHQPIWYIQTDTHQCLFTSGDLDAFLQSSAKSGVDWNGLDMIILSRNDPNSMREIQYLLLHNQKVKIYLPKEAYHQYICDILYKLNGYFSTNRIPDWVAQIMFTEALSTLKDWGWLISWEDTAESLSPPRQNLVLQEDSHMLLFTSGPYTTDELETLCKKVQCVTDQSVDYVFHGLELEQDPFQETQISFSRHTYLQKGQTITI